MSRVALARAAAGFALAELALGLTVGAFAARGRAEVAIFLAYRPWLLLALAAWMTRAPWRNRAAAYAGAILLASASEAALTGLLGGMRVAEEAARAIAAGLLLVALLDGLFVLARRVEPRFARLLGLALGVGVLLLPGPLRLYERIALPLGEPARVAARPRVTLLTGLPILWGEGGVAGAIGQAESASYRRLSAAFHLLPVDVATPATLARAPLLLAAQPRELSADEIAAIDAWVRMGGRALLLVDPDLRWPSALPPNDARQPPRWATLAPLLAGWGITVRRDAARGGVATVDLTTAAGLRRIVTDAPGSLSAGAGCRLEANGRAAACRIGSGRVRILADADMLDDRLWTGAGTDGAGRLARLGDNPLLIADWLDALADRPPTQASDSVSWAGTGAVTWVSMGVLLVPAVFGLSGLFSAALGSSHRSRRHT